MAVRPLTVSRHMLGEGGAHLRLVLRSSLADRAAARALMKSIQVASMVLASSRLGTKAHIARGCIAGLTACAS